ncbi:MAG: SGNH/GDSL hydrolase family protein [Planctomycetota bacterium]
MQIRDDDTVLFQGDSITDAGRERDSDDGTIQSLGNGYAMLTARALQRQTPGVRTINRGVSGNHLKTIRQRWAADTLDLKPTVVSLLLGVNDTWHGVAMGNPEGGTTLEYFADHLPRLIQETRTALPGVRVVLCEPFVLETGKVLDQAFHPDIDKRQEIVRRVAETDADVFVPFQRVFDDAVRSTDTNPSHWSGDGVHPTRAGHQLMADAWLEAVAAG